MASFSQGSVINTREIAREAHIERDTAETIFPSFKKRGLKEFKKDYPPARCYLFYGGSTPLYMDDISVIPIEQALRNLDQLLRPS